MDTQNTQGAPSFLDEVLSAFKGTAGAPQGEKASSTPTPDKLLAMSLATGEPGKLVDSVVQDHLVQVLKAWLATGINDKELREYLYVTAVTLASIRGGIHRLSTLSGNQQFIRNQQ